MATPSRSYKARGVVLRARNLGEADRILTLFTLEHGKVDGVAKGVRRGKSRVGGRLEFGNEVVLTLGRGRSLDVITGAEILHEHWRALVQPERFGTATLVAEMIDAFCEPELALPEIYDLLVGVLAAVAASSAPALLMPRFSLRLLDALGLGLPLDMCVRCGGSLDDERAWLDAEAGGLIDENCRERWRTLPELDAADLENLRAIAAPRGRGAALLARPRVVKAVESLIAHHLGRRPKAAAASGELGA
ncbi:MAG TPA: DNA repair protein RecO [Candidatus Tyrphobacter sp.]